MSFFTEDQVETLDASAWRCPLPLLRIKVWLKTATVGQQLRLCISDAGSRQDIPAYLLRMGHGLTEESDDGHLLMLLITKAP